MLLAGVLLAQPADRYACLAGPRPPYELYHMAVQRLQYDLPTDTLLNDSLLVLIDLRLPSCEKRLWVVHLYHDTVLYHTHVAHGVNSGEQYATRFSNIPESRQSSLGYYRTAELYEGKHGLSLRLDGRDTGWNDRARQRDIVLHSAWYANADFISTHGYCGRSWGCPAIPEDGHRQLIRAIAGGTLLLQYYPHPQWLLDVLPR